MTGDHVVCYSGAKYGERPIALIVGGERMEIAAVINEWRLPEGMCFRVITQDEARFDVYYLEAEDEWQLRALG